MHFVPVQFVRLQLPPSCGKAWSTKHLIKCLTVFPFMWQPSSSAAIPYLFIASAYTGQVARLATPCHSMHSLCSGNATSGICVQRKKSSGVYRIIVMFLCIFCPFFCSCMRFAHHKRCSPLGPSSGLGLPAE